MIKLEDIEQVHKKFLAEQKTLCILKKKHLDLSNDLQKQYDLVQHLASEKVQLKLRMIQNNPDWEWLLQDGGLNKSKNGAEWLRYNAAKKTIEELAVGKNKQVGLRAYSYEPKTGQLILKMFLWKNEEDLEIKILSAISMLLPFIKPVEIDYQDDNKSTKVKVIGIMTKDLTMKVIYEAHIDETRNMYSVVKIRHGQLEIVYNGNSLNDLLTHIRENYYFKI